MMPPVPPVSSRCPASEAIEVVIPLSVGEGHGPGQQSVRGRERNPMAHRRRPWQV